MLKSKKATHSALGSKIVSGVRKALPSILGSVFGVGVAMWVLKPATDTVQKADTVVQKASEPKPTVQLQTPKTAEPQANVSAVATPVHQATPILNSPPVSTQKMTDPFQYRVKAVSGLPLSQDEIVGLMNKITFFLQRADNASLAIEVLQQQIAQAENMGAVAKSQADTDLEALIEKNLPLVQAMVHLNKIVAPVANVAKVKEMVDLFAKNYLNDKESLAELKAIVKPVPVNGEVLREFAQLSKEERERDPVAFNRAMAMASDEDKDLLVKLFAYKLYSGKLAEQAITENYEKIEPIAQEMNDKLMETSMILNEYINFPLRGQYDLAKTPEEQALLQKIKAKYAHKEFKVNAVSALAVVKDWFVVFLNDVPKPLITNKNLDFLIMQSQPDEKRFKLNTVLNPDTLEEVLLYSADDLKINRAIVGAVEPVFKKVYGKGERKVYVFSDPDCVFCREQDLAWQKGLTAEDNVTVYQVMNPRAKLHPMAHIKASQLVCQANPDEAWADMQNNNGEFKNFKQEYDPKDYLPKDITQCLAQVNQKVAIAEVLNLTTTPITILDNGLMLFRMQTVEELRQALAGKTPML